MTSSLQRRKSCAFDLHSGHLGALAPPVTKSEGEPSSLHAKRCSGGSPYISNKGVVKLILTRAQQLQVALRGRAIGRRAQEDAQAEERRQAQRDLAGVRVHRAALQRPALAARLDVQPVQLHASICRVGTRSLNRVLLLCMGRIEARPVACRMPLLCAQRSKHLQSGSIPRPLVFRLDKKTRSTSLGPK